MNTIGLDISQKTIDATLHKTDGSTYHTKVGNNREGLKALEGWIKANKVRKCVIGMEATGIYSQTKQKIPNKACSKDKQPDITFLRCRLIFAHTFSIGFNSGEYGGSGRMICPALCAISRSTAIL